MVAKLIALGLASAVAATAFVAPAAARGPQRMIAIDETKGGKITDNGVDDGRVCKIFFAPRFDPWTERVIMMKTKRCFQF